MTQQRRAFLGQALALGAISSASNSIWAQSSTTSSSQRVFKPAVGEWRTFDVTTRVDLSVIKGQGRVWLPLPSLQTPWQQSLTHDYSTNGKAEIKADGHEGAKFLYAQFDADNKKPFVEVISRVRTKNRQTTWNDASSTPAQGLAEEASNLKYYTRATRWLPTDGIVKKTALQVTQGAKTDTEKVRALYDWVVSNTYREPKVRGCGEGDIKTMLETGNLGGKCADINAVLVGLCRSVGIPARDVYGLRLVPSAFSYKELSGNPSNLKGSQHCRSEVYLKNRGWVAMDPADVAKVMRQETPEWIKTIEHPVVKPVYQTLFGGWEGNWMGWNTSHDLVLPGSQQKEPLPFLMYPVAENDDGRLDSYDPDAFKYQITAKEIV